MDVSTSQNFNFFPVPTDIHFGCGMVRSLPERLGALGARRPMLITDPGVRAAGVLDQVTRVLQDAAVDFAVCDKVKPDSGSALIDETVAEAKTAGADSIVGIGGGSSLDTAKAVAALATNPGSALEYVGLHKIRNRPLPMIAIPTTAGTGSEVTLWSVFTDENRAVKAAIGSILIYPAVALCDPDLTLGLPPNVTAATGMDALAHAIECYTNNNCQPISGALALRAMELIGRYLRSAVLNGGNRQARYGMMLASTMAGIAMNPTRLGLAHALAMPLGSWDLRVPHGVVLAITLPNVMEFNYRAEPDRFVDVARALGEAVDGLPRRAAAARSVSAVRELAADIGIPKGLGEFGVCAKHVRPVVDEAMKSGNVPVNPRRTCAEDLARILEQSL
ncbi:MAG TPA: iron-containing alcohol dehydrogenase [Verrucomicrobiae bacterium]|nr:iron-containing alcohol dehydrogenase [Verrucomicrobiae bacterium]